MNLKMSIFSTLLLSFTFSSLQAEDIKIPTIQKPALLQEGVQRVLTQEQVNELLPWAKDSKIFLIDLLAALEGLNSEDKVSRLLEGIDQVVRDSGGKNSEMFMRYVLNRAVVIHGLLNKEIDSSAVGSLDAKIALLTNSIKMAIRYYDVDVKYLQTSSSAPYASFGKDYFIFLKQLNKSIVDASAQYTIERTALEFLQWDLYRDINNKAAASKIVKINNGLKLYPADKKMKDSQYLVNIRQMKALGEQLYSVTTKNGVSRSSKENIIETVQHFTMPNIHEVYFGLESSLDGVCIALGFQKSVKDSLQKKSMSDHPIVKINEEGNAIEGVYQLSSREIVSAIDCQNKVIEKEQLELAIVKNPMIDEIRISSTYSSEEAVCKMLGYESGVKGTGLVKINQRGSFLEINNSNTSPRGVSGEFLNVLEELVCTKKVENEIKRDYTFEIIELPKYAEKYNLSVSSNEQGVCRYLGYKGSAEGSIFEMNGAVVKTFVLDITGAVINKEVSLNGEKVSLIYKIICYK